MGTLISLFTIWYGFIFGLLDWISDIAYFNSATFD